MCMAADHEDNTVCQDEKVGEGRKAESFVGGCNYSKANKGWKYYKKPGKIILRVDGRPN